MQYADIHLDFLSSHLEVCDERLRSLSSAQTVTDVQLRPLGLVFGSLAVLSTSIFQIWQGTKQKEFGVSAMQLQSSIALWQSVQSFAVAAAVESTCWSEHCHRPMAIAFFQNAMGTGIVADHTFYILQLVLVTCFLALMVNFCSFGLIGRTGPITFQVRHFTDAAPAVLRKPITPNDCCGRL